MQVLFSSIIPLNITLPTTAGGPSQNQQSLPKPVKNGLFGEGGRFVVVPTPPPSP
jgi:hypothetical protein